jgi:hypothetical protein
MISYIGNYYCVMLCCVDREFLLLLTFLKWICFKYFKQVHMVEGGGGDGFWVDLYIYRYTRIQ